MIQGGGFAPGMKQKPTRQPVANEAGNGVKNRKYTVAMARTSDPHSASAQFFINVADNDFLDYKSPSPNGWGYCVFAKVVGRHRRRRAHQGRPDRQCRDAPERAEGRRRDSTRRGRGSGFSLTQRRGRLKPAPLGWLPFALWVRLQPDAMRRPAEAGPTGHEADALPVRPAPRAGPRRGRRSLSRVRARPGARRRRRLHPRRSVRRVDRRRPAPRSASRARSPTRCALNTTPASPLFVGAWQSRLPARRALRARDRRDDAARAADRRYRQAAPRRDPRRRALHRRRRLPAVSRADALGRYAPRGCCACPIRCGVASPGICAARAARSTR